MNCKWIIIAPFGYAIQLTWVRFSLEKRSDCGFDYVDIYENNTITGKSQLIGKYCGQTKPPAIISSFNVVTVIFVTDSSVSESGFLLSYTFVEEKSGMFVLFTAAIGTSFTFVFSQFVVELTYHRQVF